jgi:hypothetical protein
MSGRPLASYQGMGTSGAVIWNPQNDRFTGRAITGEEGLAIWATGCGGLQLAVTERTTKGQRHSTAATMGVLFSDHSAAGGTKHLTARLAIAVLKIQGNVALRAVAVERDVFPASGRNLVDNRHRFLQRIVRSSKKSTAVGAGSVLRPDFIVTFGAVQGEIRAALGTRGGLWQ